MASAPYWGGYPGYGYAPAYGYAPYAPRYYGYAPAYPYAYAPYRYARYAYGPVVPRLRYGAYGAPVYGLGPISRLSVSLKHRRTRAAPWQVRGASYNSRLAPFAGRLSRVGQGVKALGMGAA